MLTEQPILITSIKAPPQLQKIFSLVLTAIFVQQMPKHLVFQMLIQMKQNSFP